MNTSIFTASAGEDGSLLHDRLYRFLSDRLPASAIPSHDEKEAVTREVEEALQLAHQAADSKAGRRLLEVIPNEHLRGIAETAYAAEMERAKMSLAALEQATAEQRAHSFIMGTFESAYASFERAHLPESALSALPAERVEQINSIRADLTHLGTVPATQHSGSLPQLGDAPITPALYNPGGFGIGNRS